MLKSVSNIFIAHPPGFMLSINRNLCSMGESHKRKFHWQCVARICLCLAFAYVLLLIPEGTSPQSEGAGKQPFVWNRAQLWASLERSFVQAREDDKTVVSNQIARLMVENRRLLAEMTNLSALDPKWSELDTNLFKLAPLVAADPARLPDFAVMVNAIRREAKQQSSGWDLNSDPARERLYRLLVASRMALEEVLLQNPKAAGDLPAECDAEPSQTASAVLRGVTLRSGDILVSRGSAPTSALISRGNDYAGAFSHVSLLHVDSATGAACIIQALIEKGVIVTPLQEYSHDRKLRLMVLRPRADLPAVAADPQAPHKVAALALKEAMAKHIPYDFAMDYRDHSALFCSEVVSAAYEKYGMPLWMGMSHISSPTVAAWLGSLGVRHFKTQEPADLEYDPQLRVVAEWREAPALWQAHLDDAVTDAMLANAKPGKPLPFNRLKLPLARAAKAYSVLLNWFGHLGPIPQGMSATTALRADKYRADHAAIKKHLTALAATFQETHHYSPPYWELVRLATQAHAEITADGDPPKSTKPPVPPGG
jgi:hypothetical protein